MNQTLLALVLALSAPAAAQAPRIGAAGAVSGQVTAGSSSGRRALKSGSEVFHKDSVTTDAKGRLQVMLLDQTVFTVGPDSNIVLDEFIYDPFTNTGKVTAQVTKGVFRFVTGKVAGKKPADMKIKIPAGTIGIRGTFGAGVVQPNGDALIGLLGPGSDNNGDERTGGMDINTGSDSQSLDEPGTGVTVKSDGDVSEPFILTPEQAASLNAGGGDPPSGGPGAGTSSGDAGGGSEDESASSSAGQDTALARESSSASGAIGDESSSLNDSANTASQAAASGGIRDGLAKWDDVRTLPSGQAHYNGTGSWNLTTCNGGTCANDNAGTMSFQMNIDFGARTYGGGGSTASGQDSDANAATQGQINASVTINSADFTSLTGDARISATQGVCSMTADLINSGGAPATSATATLTYSSGGDIGSGSLTAPRVDGLIPQ